VSFFAGLGLARLVLSSVESAKVNAGRAAEMKSSVVRAEVEPIKPVNADTTTRQRLEVAVAGGDPLTSAAHLLTWLETATVEDFQALAAEPEKFPLPYFTGVDQELYVVFQDAMAGRWIELDPGGALAAMQRLQAEQLKRIGLDLSELLKGAARVRPDLVLEKLPLVTKSNELESLTRTALRALAARDAKAARQFLDRFTDAKTREAAGVEIARGIADGEPLAGIALARQTNDEGTYNAAMSAAQSIGPGMVRQVFHAAGGKFDGDSALLMRYPDLIADLKDVDQNKAGTYFDDRFLLLADRMPSEERQRILANCDALPAGTRDNLAAALACSWARSDPPAAAEWALAHAKTNERANSANTAAQKVFLRWANNDADAALVWWRALPASPLRDALGTEASTFLAEKGRFDAALELFHPQDGKADETITTQLAQFLSGRDPANAAAWLSALPSGVSTEKAAQAVLRDWFPREPEAAARWVEALPAGPRRDEVLTAFVEEAAQHSLAGAAEWVETVADPKMRQQAAQSVYWRWRNDDPAAAQEWMRQLSGVDPEWRARLLRRIR
jgi:hypothetical protein